MVPPEIGFRAEATAHKGVDRRVVKIYSEYMLYGASQPDERREAE
jgi:hypothetical protein